MALRDNLVSWWELNETSGTRNDSHGSNHLTDVNTVGYGTGKQGNAGDFERSNSEYLTYSGLLGDLNSDFSVSFWVNPETVPPTVLGIFQFFSWWRKSGDDSYFASLMIDYFAGSKYLQILLEGASGVEDYYAHSMTAGNWYHIAFVVDVGTGYTLYINGTSVKTGSAPTKKTSSPGAASSFFEIGESHAQNDTRYGRYYDGLMDEFGVWSRVLTSDEITELYASGAGLDYAGTASGSDAIINASVLALTSSIENPTVTAVKNISVSSDTLVLTSSLPTPTVTAGANTFPNIQATATTESGTRLTSHTINLPTGIQADDLLMLFVTAAGTTDGDAMLELATITTPSGWTQLFNETNSSEVRHACYYKTASGSEGSTLALTTTGARVSSIAHRITGYTSIPESATANGSSTTPDAPSLTPSWGAKDTLWITSIGTRTPRTVTDSPDNFANNNQAVTGSVSSSLHCRTNTMDRDETTTSQDPTSWTLDASVKWVASTVAIEPATVANVTVNAGVLDITASLPTPAVAIGANVSPSTLVLTTSIPTPQIDTGGTINPAPLELTISLPTPTITAVAHVTVSCDVVTATVSLPTPTISAVISGDVTVSPACLEVTVSAPSPSVTTTSSITVSADVATLAISLLAPRKFGSTWSRVARVGNGSDWDRVARVE